MTGAPLEVTIRMQANLLVQPIEELSLFQDVPRIFMPAFWFEQKFVMDEEMAKQIKIAVQIPWYGRVAGFAMMGMGIVLVLISSFIAFTQSKRDASRQQMEINLGDRKIDGRKKKEASPLIDQISRPRIVQQRRGSSLNAGKHCA